MLGDSLLVAPIFNEEGRGEFYLPEGEWMNLLDEEVLDGGRFYSRIYDYMHLPLFVAENTLLPMGSCETSPEYDYQKGLTLRYYLPVDGVSTEMEIPDLTGKTVLTASAIKEGNTVTVELSDATYPVHLEIYVDEEIKIFKELTETRTNIEL